MTNRPKTTTQKKMTKGRIFRIKLLRAVLSVFLVLILTGVICLGAFGLYVMEHIAPYDEVNPEVFGLNFTSMIYYTDRDTGEAVPLEKLHGEQNRVWAYYQDIPQAMKDAFISIEDERFPQHNGVDWKRTIGAGLNVFLNIRSGSFGGSTITQQLIKNLTGDNDVKLQRKILEIMRALKLEKNYSKDQILEWYLNTINCGQGCYGVRAAAEVYFNKDISELNIAECATIAGITNRPTFYDPFQNPENNKKRQEAILKKMLELGKITREEYDEAIVFELDFKKTQHYEQLQVKQSYFVDQVILEVLDVLINEKGYSEQLAKKMVYSGGLQIYTTCEPRIQAILDDVFSNDANFPTLRGEVQPQCAMVIMNSAGEVVGIAGGRGEKEANRIWNYATQEKRQPGSAIKPITVYAPAIENGYITPDSYVLDEAFTTRNNKPWPSNYYRSYYGPMTVMKAVEISANAPVVRILDKLGVEKSYDFARNNMGLTSLVAADKDYAPLALGGLTNGISVMELTAAYVPFVNKGVYVKPKTFTKITDSKGTVIYENKKEGTQAISTTTVVEMNKLLRNVNRNGTGTVAAIPNMVSAGKTGTTTADNDRWYVGYTPYYVGAVWFGYARAKTVSGVSSNPSALVWKKVMSRVHEGLQSKDFDSGMNPNNVYYYCKDSGRLATDACRNDVRGSRVSAGDASKSKKPASYCSQNHTQAKEPLVIKEIEEEPEVDPNAPQTDPNNPQPQQPVDPNPQQPVDPNPQQPQPPVDPNPQQPVDPNPQQPVDPHPQTPPPDGGTTTENNHNENNNNQNPPT